MKGWRSSMTKLLQRRDAPDVASRQEREAQLRLSEGRGRVVVVKAPTRRNGT